MEHSRAACEIIVFRSEAQKQNRERICVVTVAGLIGTKQYIDKTLCYNYNLKNEEDLWQWLT